MRDAFGLRRKSNRYSPFPVLPQLLKLVPVPYPRLANAVPLLAGEPNTGKPMFHVEQFDGMAKGNVPRGTIAGNDQPR